MRQAYVIAALALAVVLLLDGCDGGKKDSRQSTAAGESRTAAGASASPTSPSTSAPAKSATTAAPLVTPVSLDPSIEEALSCRVPPVRANDPGGKPPLQREDIDPRLFPGSACNDGTPAVLDFRPYSGEANKDKWVIGLAGGGSCSSGQECADRWCGVGTNFDADNMSTANAGAGATADGIYRRSADNPFGNWNQVYVRYCSSDGWAGGGLAATLKAKDPKTGSDVTFQINFAGENVFEAMLAILRQEGVPGLVYTNDGKRTPMPDLDNATEVVFAGGSAGGAGVVNNLDRLADLLRDAPGHPVVQGLIDSIVGPDSAHTNYSQSMACQNAGVCTYEALFKAIAANDQNVLKRSTDESCLQWHQQHDPGSEWKCYDYSHVLANHITTPFFVRQGLTDRQRSGESIDAGFASTDGKVFTKATWGLATRETLLGLPQAVLSGEEKDAVTKAPGIFAPSCSNHYTIYEDNTTYGTTTVSDGKTYMFFDVWKNWVAGAKPDVVISADPRTDKCPGG